MVGVTNDHGDANRALLLRYLTEFYRERRYMPTIAQMAAATGLQRTAVAWHLQKLREQKKLDFEDGNMSRSLRLP